MDKKPILCVDFDGVLHSYKTPWQGAAVVADPPVDGALDFLRKAVAHFQVCIFSSRSQEPSGVKAMRDALSRWGLEWAVLAQLEFPRYKPSAFLTIDDRCWPFIGIFPDPETLLAFKPWNKR